MALAFHERLIALFGGAPGLIDEGRLDAALASPKNQFHYAITRPDVFQLAAAYAHALTRDHPFVDGNKRMALVVSGVFLQLNGFRLEASEAEALSATEALSNRSLEEEEFANWLRDSSKKVTRTKATGPKTVNARSGRTSRKSKSKEKRTKKEK